MNPGKENKDEDRKEKTRDIRVAVRVDQLTAFRHAACRKGQLCFAAREARMQIGLHSECIRDSVQGEEEEKRERERERESLFLIKELIPAEKTGHMTWMQKLLC